MGMFSHGKIDREVTQQWECSVTVRQRGNTAVGMFSHGKIDREVTQQWECSVILR